jgi:hypothetical protein
MGYRLPGRPDLRLRDFDVPLGLRDLHRLVLEATVREYVVQRNRLEAIDEQQRFAGFEVLKCCHDVAERFALNITNVKYLIVICLCGIHTCW